MGNLCSRDSDFRVFSYHIVPSYLFEIIRVVCVCVYVCLCVCASKQTSKHVGAKQLFSTTWVSATKASLNINVKSARQFLVIYLLLMFSQFKHPLTPGEFDSKLYHLELLNQSLITKIAYYIYVKSTSDRISFLVHSFEF